jgi:outer membrane lipoprotein carrier protein
MFKLIILLFPAILFSSSLNLKDFQSDFIQTITTPKNKISTYSGRIKFLDKSMKWEYLLPSKKEICSRGNQMLIVNHDLEQVTLLNSIRKINILKVLNKAKLHHKNIYTVKMFDTLYTISITNNKINYITFYDNLENKILIQFKNIQFKKSKNMKCNYPSEYDFING